MKRYKLTLELHEDAIFSARAATLGGHRSLDYIPGATLYGVSASKLYNSMPDDAFTIFHSGKVRFGNGYPATPSGETGYPFPFAWHVIKGESHKNEGDNRLLASEKLYSPLFEGGASTAGKQLKQLRDGYVTNSGLLIQPKTTFRMKTAIDPASATAAEAQLFGYEAIGAGQKFHAMLDFDDDIDNSVIDKVCSSLNGFIRIGRSRSAQYGTAMCKLSEAPVPDPPPLATNNVTLWLISDLSIGDENGMLALEPLPERLGLGSGKIDPDKSFLRFRYYSPYNTARRSYDQERHVIQQGSVLTYNLVNAPDDEMFKRLLHGLGKYRSNGLGQVMINPDLLRNPPSPARYPDMEINSIEEPKNHPLVIWLKSQVETGSLKRKDKKLAEKFNRQLTSLYESARKYAGESPGSLVGPGKTQWGLILDAGKRFSANREGLIAKFQEICKPDDEEWAKQTGIVEDPTFGEWLLNRFRREEGIHNAGNVASNLARLAMDTVITQKMRDSGAIGEGQG
jgi:CRISPR-associated protein Csx10